MSDTLRTQLKAIAVKIETTSGVDVIGGNPVAGDFIAADFDPSFPQDVADNPEMTASLDANAGIPGGIRPSITIRVPLRGTGAAGTAPEWGKLMKACSYVETVTTPAVGAPTAATAGTTTSVTLATPFAATAQAYRGMPITLSGNPATPLTTLIQDYTAGRVASLIETLAAAATVGTMAQIPPNVLYAPTSDESLWKTVTIYAYIDGIRHRFVGCSGTWSLEGKAGGTAMLSFEMRGVLLDAMQAVALPSGWNSPRPTPPLWIAGRSQLNRLIAKTDRLSYAAGVALADPENPEAPQGYDAPILTGRAGQLQIAPYATTTLSPTRFANFQAGISVPYGAVIGGSAGNRVGLVLPNGRVTRFDVSNRNKLGVDQLTLAPDGAEQSATLCVF